MDKAGHQDIHQAGGHHAAAGVGEHLDVGDGKLPVCIGQLGGQKSVFGHSHLFLPLYKSFCLRYNTRKGLQGA